MRIQQSSFLLILFFFTSLIVRGQSVTDFTCAFDALRNPAQTSRMELFEQQTAPYFLQKEAPKALQKDFSGLPYVVPVVVHIIHDGGAENISDARILAALDHLNEGFAAQGYFAQQGATVHTQIQFCLAKRDPKGNATTGITRTQSPFTNMTMETEDIQTKNLNRWNPKEYVNIWVVKEITSSSLGPGVAGYAYFPSSHGQPEDGMICEARFFGASAADDAVLIHEMGHYFGLYHTFEGGCKNDNCAVDGDRVCDTPPDKATHTNCPFNSCSTDVAAGSPFSSDVADFTHDFMDYSPLSCYSSFTAGQATRMQVSVETARKSLLFSKGCLDPCTLPIVASFLAAPNPIFAGQSLALTNTSTGGANFSWSDNGNVFSQNQNASLILNTIGNHLIVLNATNADPNCVDTAQVVVQVQCPVTADFSVPQYEIKPGTSLAFTNTSTGGATAFEWSINGVSLATTANFSYLFSTPGYYSVKLQAVGPACGQEKTVQIHVKSFCGEPFFAVTKYSYQKNYLAIYDMVGLADGSAIQCGKNAQRPMMSRIDAVGNMIWQRTLNMPGSFDDIEPLPDGHFILHGQANSKFLLAKIDDSGNLLWFRTLQNPDGVLVDDASVNAVAANPDGSFIFHYLGQLGSGILGKMLPDGTLLWTKRYQNLMLTGGLRRATDGSGDILLSTIMGVTQFSVFRINQAGNLVTIYQYTLPQQPIAGTHKGYFDVYPNGDFALIFLVYKVNSFVSGVKYMIRCKPNGQPRWAKKLEANGYNSQFLYARYFPGEGWLLSDNKANADKYLIRLNDKDELMWERKMGVGGWQGDRVYCSIKQNGMIRAMKAVESTLDIDLLQLPDEYTPITCLPDVPQKDVFTNIAVNMVEVSATVTPVNLVFVPEPYVFLNEPLSRTPSCSLVLSCPESCDNGLDDDQDGFVDCFDTDCKCFDADTLCTIVPPQEPLSVRIAWESASNLVQETSTPIVGNLNPQVDSIPEIIVQSHGADELLIFRGDGSNASNPIHFKPINANILDQTPPLLLDINSDGRPELLVATWEGKISVYTNYQENASPPFTLWFEGPPAVTGWVSMLNAADFDHDGIPEIFVGRQVFGFDFTNPAAPTLTRKLVGANHSGGFPGAGSGFLDVSAAADILSRADCNGDPDCDGLELAAGAYIYSVDLDVSDGDGLQIKVQRNLNQLAPGANYSDGFTQIADINLDGTPDVVVNGVKNLLSKPVDGIYVWDKNGLISFLPMYPSDNWKAWSKLTIANVFDDRKAGFAQDFPEIIGKLADSMRLAAFSLHAQTLNSAQPFWWEAPSDDESVGCFVTAFDFNRDGYDELVAKGDHFLRIYYGGAAPFPPGVHPKTRVWAELGHVAGTVYDGAIVADANGDHEAEILYTHRTNGPQGRLRVLESAHFPWPTARPIWNQYSYFHAGINDDLSVPKTQQKHWLEMGGIGSGKRPFNTHLAQVASLNPTPDNKLRVPDARISLDSTHCQTDSSFTSETQL